MADVGRAIFTLAGAVIGAAIGGPIGMSIGTAIGSTIGTELFPYTVENYGPRLEDLTIQQNAYGRPIYKVMGRMRIAGTVIWALPIIEERVEETTTTGSGKSKTEVTSVYYKYYATCAIALCQGPIQGVYKIWADNKLIYNVDTNDQQTLDVSFTTPVTFYYGDETQEPPALIESHLGVGNVPGYRGLALAVFNRLPLEDFANRLPNFTFEVLA